MVGGRLPFEQTREKLSHVCLKVSHNRLRCGNLYVKNPSPFNSFTETSPHLFILALASVSSASGPSLSKHLPMLGSLALTPLIQHTCSFPPSNLCLTHPQAFAKIQSSKSILVTENSNPWVSIGIKLNISITPFLHPVPMSRSLRLGFMWPKKLKWNKAKKQTIKLWLLSGLEQTPFSLQKVVRNTSIQSKLPSMPESVCILTESLLLSGGILLCRQNQISFYCHWADVSCLWEEFSPKFKLIETFSIYSL